MSPTFHYESQTAKLELRIMELEDTTAAIIGIIRTMNSMLGTMNEIVNHTADSLGGLVLALPSTTHRLPLWPAQSPSRADKIPRCNPLCSCANSPDPEPETPSTP